MDLWIHLISSIPAELAMTGAAATLFALWLLLPVAFKLKLVDLPAGRKDHDGPTPSIGGIAMAIGMLLTAYSILRTDNAAFRAFTIGSVLLVACGMVDDKFDLKWYWRVLVQSVAALVMVYVGGVQVQHLGVLFGLGDLSLGALAVPFTVFATVGLINAINMVDGADGVAGLLVIAALAMEVAAAAYSGNQMVLQIGTVLLGVVSAFLVCNMRFPWQSRAKTFMGNGGSAFLGFAIAWMTFSLTQNPQYPVTPALALWLVPVPVMDTLVLMIRRVRAGQSPFAGDRNHIHHLMLEGGFGPTQAALVLTGFTLICGLGAGEALRMDMPIPALLALFMGMTFAWYWLTSRRERAILVFTMLNPLARREVATLQETADGYARSPASTVEGIAILAEARALRSDAQHETAIRPAVSSNPGLPRPHMPAITGSGNSAPRHLPASPR